MGAVKEVRMYGAGAVVVAMCAAMFECMVGSLMGHKLASPPTDGKIQF